MRLFWWRHLSFAAVLSTMTSIIDTPNRIPLQFATKDALLVSKTDSSFVEYDLKYDFRTDEMTVIKTEVFPKRSVTFQDMSEEVSEEVSDTPVELVPAVVPNTVSVKSFFVIIIFSVFFTVFGNDF